jgi:hypothetical protein
MWVGWSVRERETIQFEQLQVGVAAVAQKYLLARLVAGAFLWAQAEQQRRCQSAA